MVLGLRLQPGQQRQEAVLVAVQRDDPRHLGAAGGQRAGLVEGEGIDGGQRFQRRAALEENAAARRRRKRRQDRGRNRDDDGAGAGGDQQRRRPVERLLPVAPSHRRRRRRDRAGQHRDRIALAEPCAEPLGRRAGGLRLGHQPDHAGDRAVADGLVTSPPERRPG
jgi:hypothetical protein